MYEFQQIFTIAASPPIGKLFICAVLLSAGANIKRDAIDKKVREQWVDRLGGDNDPGDLSKGDGLINEPHEAGGWPELVVEKVDDVDRDGIADLAEGPGLVGDPRNPWLYDHDDGANDDNVDRDDDWTNLEAYLDRLAEIQP